MSLKVNYKDDVLGSGATRRKYRQINNADGTVSFEDATPYDVQGDTFGSVDINATNQAVNDLTGYFDNILLVESLPSDASSHTRTLYLSKS